MIIIGLSVATYDAYEQEQSDGDVGKGRHGLSLHGR
jgi:hypothetical protein